jgi:hypothetical protein
VGLSPSPPPPGAMATTAGKRKRVPDEQGLPQKGALGYRLGNAVSTVGIQTPFVRSLMQQDQESSSLPISELLYRACIEVCSKKIWSTLSCGMQAQQLSLLIDFHRDI